MTIVRNMLLASLAKTIADYRQNEIAPITPVHIERWLNQFDASDQLTILAEMDAILKRFYFSRMRVKECIRTFIKDFIINIREPEQVLPHVSFLQIQKVGSSQGGMLEIADEILREEYSFTLSMVGTKGVKTYIYLDDCIYTGSRLRYDLTDGTDTIGWFSNCPSKCTLWVYTIAAHTKGINYVRKYVQEAAKKKQVNVRRETSLMINNIHSIDSSIEVLWPEKLQDYYVDSYVVNLRASLPLERELDYNFFRYNAQSSQERLFSSLEARRVVERAFLKKGAQFIATSQRPAPSMRPLGFMKLHSLGFGTFFVTYRNIANNCPLVLWWGDPTFPSTHPFSQWYPLFPRRTNAQRDIVIREQIFDYVPF